MNKIFTLIGDFLFGETTKVRISIKIFNKTNSFELEGQEAKNTLTGLNSLPVGQESKTVPFVCISSYLGIFVNIFETKFTQPSVCFSVLQAIACDCTDANITWNITNQNFEIEQITKFFDKFSESFSNDERDYLKYLKETYEFNQIAFRQKTNIFEQNVDLLEIDKSRISNTNDIKPKETQALNLTAPKFEPNIWNNNLLFLQNNNCYTYALNIKGNHNPNGIDPANTKEDDVLKNCLSDGLEKVETIPANTNDPYIALFISTTSRVPNDYHFFRRDSDGTWSFKNGNCNVTNRDFVGNKITDIMSCNTGRFNQFIAFFKVTPATIQKVSALVIK